MALEDPEVINYIKEKNIHLEICPTSNWLTNNVKSLENHPIVELYKNDVSISLNSDDPQIMNIDLLNEYVLAGVTGKSKARNHSTSRKRCSQKHAPQTRKPHGPAQSEGGSCCEKCQKAGRNRS